ncbi:DNA endonuclease RBBP8 isoform X2 [Parambassis ranga]|uniref:DNA endonuclease RBBP8 isoform X2 n=1 Tax=Parambassis ranga TaxID=210632 RepID=A0A6P7IP72_9TELE|nr:RBBP8 N-terminal-like protein isoform X2 [Parambassis ranga]
MCDSQKEMECFNDLLHKLREAHEREVEGWQVKVQELSNKKGCDTKRMEELFTRNQQMKEQQRLLTENIKTLENRLRAGLCDRCTVTQEVAKRRQQEFEASQIQSLQHITLLAGEMNNLKKENKRLQDEIKNLRAALEGHSNHSSNSSNTTELKANSSPDLSPPCRPVALITSATSRASNQPADGDIAVKTETDQKQEGFEQTDTEPRKLRVANRNQCELYKPVMRTNLILPPWKADHNVARVGERRTQSLEGPDQRCSIPPQTILKKSSSSLSGEVKPIKHVLHAPVPCRPQPIKSSHVSLPWPLSESSEWVTVAAAGTNPMVQTSPKPSLPRFPNLIPLSQQATPRRQVVSSHCSKQSPTQPPEPTVVFRLKSLAEYLENHTKPVEKKESTPAKVERVSREGVYDGPLDLSDRGKSKSSQTPRDDSPLQGGIREKQKSPDTAVNADSSAHAPVSSSLPLVHPSSSRTPQVKQEPEPTSDNKQAAKEQEHKEEVNGKTDQGNEKKVPVLTISLRPVVLENLNSALQKQDSLSSFDKSSSPVDEPESSSGELDEEGTSGSGHESNHGCKRKRASETETDRDSDTASVHKERKISITVRTEEKSSS